MKLLTLLWPGLLHPAMVCVCVGSSVAARGDRLSRILRCSTMGAAVFHGRVRDGIGCVIRAMTTEPPRRIQRDWLGDGMGLVGLGRLFCVCVCWARFGAACGAAFVGPRCAGGGFEFCRAIRTARLRRLPDFHLRPIDVMVYHGPRGRPRLEGGFLLRCLQQLSRPHLATQRCSWRNNWYTRGTSIPVLSY